VTSGPPSVADSQTAAGRRQKNRRI